MQARHTCEMLSDNFPAACRAEQCVRRFLDCVLSVRQEDEGATAWSWWPFTTEVGLDSGFASATFSGTEDLGMSVHRLNPEDTIDYAAAAAPWSDQQWRFLA